MKTILTMAVEIEHEKDSTEEQIRKAERDFKIESIARGLGKSVKEVEDGIDDIRQFFNLNKKEILEDFRRQRDEKQSV